MGLTGMSEEYRKDTSNEKPITNSPDGRPFPITENKDKQNSIG